jgi:hypothetical protein
MNNKYEILILPMKNIPCQTDCGLYDTYCIDRTLYERIPYLVCNMRGDEFYTYYEMWYEDGFIGNYRVLNSDLLKCEVIKYVEDDFEISK